MYEAYNPHPRRLSQMNIKSIVLPVIVFSALNISSVNADNKGVIFPPENILHSYQYPPKAPIAPRFNRVPSQPMPYFMGKNIPQPRFTVPPPQIPNYLYGRYPVRPRVMQNRNYPPVAPRNFAGNRFNNNFNNSRGNNNFPFSNNMIPFGNSGNNSFNPFSNGNMPFSNNSGGMMPQNPMNNMFGNNNNQNWNMPFFNSNNKKRKKAWGTKRNIWPDFYTDFTDDAWDTMMSGPRDLGKMPGGWRFPYISMPDPVTVSDAITNQFPPIAEEAGNMADFSDWGIFDNK